LKVRVAVTPVALSVQYLLKDIVGSNRLGIAPSDAFTVKPAGKVPAVTLTATGE
jgi:hypothetical protein